MKKHLNNFDFIRLLAACMVIVSHTIGDKGFDDPLQIFTGYLSMGVLGVFIFFLISGYLITMSWVKGNNLIKYFTNRVLRIFPGLMMVVLLTIFVIGPLFTTLSLHNYFINPETYKYLFNLTLMKLHYTLPAVFLNHGVETKINPPLWTLVFEFMMYILVAAFGLLGLLRKEKIFFWLFVSICIGIIAIYSFTHIPVGLYFLKFNVGGFVEFYSYFFLGALYYFFQEKFKIYWWMVMLLGIVWYFSIDTFMFRIVNLFFIASLVFFIAFYKKKIGTFITKHGDFSYGMYLYGSIASNIILFTISDYLTTTEQVILALIFTVPFAMASWYLIESRALKFKK